MRRQLRRREDVCRTARTCVSLNPKLQWLLCFALSNYRSLLRHLHCAPPNKCVARRCVKLQRWTLKYCIAQVPTPHLEALRNTRCVCAPCLNAKGSRRVNHFKFANIRLQKIWCSLKRVQTWHDGHVKLKYSTGTCKLLNRVQYTYIL